MKRLTLAVTIITLIASGCDVEQSTLHKIGEAALTAHHHAPAATRPADRTAMNAETEVAFEPPYPDRVDPFLMPAGSRSSQISVAQSPTITQVRVLGFAEVGFSEAGSTEAGESRVLLSIRGVTYSLGESESADGIDVLEIRGSAVDLRSGTLVWTATMFDEIEQVNR